MAIIRLPTEEQIRIAWMPYVTAIGSVAHAWNYLQESLGRLFAVILELDDSVALPIWYSTTNDRAQREMLRAAATATVDVWGAKFPKFAAELKWLLDKANSVADQRNDAIHAPCGLSIGEDDLEIMPSYFGGNPRAQKLRGKNILEEFALCEASAETLSKYSKSIFSAMVPPHSPWPNRPLMPTLGQMKTHKG